MTFVTRMRDECSYTLRGGLVILERVYKKEQAMYKLTIDTAKCEGDGDCVDACPVTLIALVEGKAVVTGDMTECLGCEACTTTCTHDALVLQDI